MSENIQDTNEQSWCDFHNFRQLFEKVIFRLDLKFTLASLIKFYLIS